MALDFTVAIPVYNGGRQLLEVVERLRSQRDADSLDWEILIVNNNSTDDTAQIIAELEANWSHPVPLRSCVEPRQGLAFARQRAVTEAQGRYVGFLDDDNWPAPDWVAAAYRFGEAHPQAGAFGGQIAAQVDDVAPQWFEKVKSFLVVRKYANEPKLFQPERLRLPPGAGLVVRRAAWLESVPAQMIRVQRGGNDYEISLRMHNHGWEIWFDPAMQITHHIPAWRVERPYLMAIARLYGLCTCELLMIITQPRQRPVVLARNFLGSLRRLVRHLLRHRQRAWTDPALACQLAFIVGNLGSPFFYLRNEWRRRQQDDRPTPPPTKPELTLP